MYSQRASCGTGTDPDFDGLATSVHRIERIQQLSGLRFGVPAEPGWLRCDDLLDDPERLRAWQGKLAAWLSTQYDEVPARTVAAWIASWYLHVPARAAALLFHHERRVPASRLAFRLSDDRPHPEEIALLGETFHCLPDDTGAARPEATVVADEQALAAVLRDGYLAHATRFIGAYGPMSRLGTRTLWAAATDALDTALWSAGTPDAGVADAALVLGSRHAPLTAASTLRLDGANGWTRRQESCCFSYLLASASECDGCPRSTPKS
ncbi:iron-sulfur protein [Amycolatopsis sp. NPDC059657]|uniref:iron-sulfur protein n=1 Tax=Amycolatopsis sp. NPDC059657 TaxID=3346899 RepID=UPI00366F3414